MHLMRRVSEIEANRAWVWWLGVGGNEPWKDIIVMFDEGLEDEDNFSFLHHRVKSNVYLQKKSRTKNTSDGAINILAQLSLILIQ